jgi:excisionase family DNA binding protein
MGVRRLTAGEVAERLHVSTDTVHEMIKRGSWLTFG